MSIVVAILASACTVAPTPAPAAAPQPAAEQAAAGLWALEHAGEFSLPLLLMHGDADRITSAAASREFAARVPGCTFKIWDGCYHEIHNEPEQQALFATITGWLHAHTS